MKINRLGLNFYPQLAPPFDVAQDVEHLKESFLEALGQVKTGSMSLKRAIIGLRERGISRAAMVDWAVAAGYAKVYVRSIMSRFFCGHGDRKNAPGQGRKVPSEAIELLALAQERYGDMAVSFLGAAYRIGKRRNLPPSLDTN